MLLASMILKIQYQLRKNPNKPKTIEAKKPNYAKIKGNTRSPVPNDILTQIKMAFRINPSYIGAVSL